MQNQNYKFKKVKIGSIYWVNIGQNAGSEIYGKNENFTHPVLVINKIYIPNFINAFVGVPLSSKTANKNGYMFYRFKTTNNKDQVALLSQLRFFDNRRISDYHRGKILKADFENIKNKIKENIIK